MTSERITREDVEALTEAMLEQREEIREALAADLGGEPADYDGQQYLRELERDK